MRTSSTLGGGNHQNHHLARNGSGGTGKRHMGTNLRSDKQETAAEMDEEGDSSFSGYFTFIRDKKRFSWAMLSVLKNNMVSAPFFYLLLILDYLILIGLFLVFCLTQF